MKQSFFLFFFFSISISFLYSEINDWIIFQALFILKKCDLLNIYETELKPRQQKAHFSLTGLGQHVASVGVIINVAWLRRCRSWRSIQPIRVDLSRLDRSTLYTRPNFSHRVYSLFLPTCISTSQSQHPLLYGITIAHHVSPEITFFRLVN